MTPQYTIADARYCKGKFAVRCPSESWMKSHAARIAECLGGRWTNREKAYIMSQAAVDKFLILVDSGIVGDVAILEGQRGTFSYYDEATDRHVEDMTAAEAVKLAKRLLVERAEAAAAPVAEVEAVEPVAEVAPLDRVLSFADFVEECGKAYGEVQAELVDERPVVEFGAIEPVPADEPVPVEQPVEQPVELPRLTVADLRRLIDERPARSRTVPPADMVPVEPFQPREPVVEAVEPAVVIDWIRASQLARAARRRPAPARVVDRPLVASDLF